MSFDAIPEDKEQSFPCPDCDAGSIKLNGQRWECDSCDFLAPENDGGLDEGASE